VFSPGDRAAFFGGDPDNFNFPRYDLDCAFLRLYEDGRAVATPYHLVWNATPPTAGQAVFVAGNPGGTFREQTVSQLETQRDEDVIVRSTINLGHALELKVVAEGVEEASSWNTLKRLGCDLIQGYFVSKPLPVSEFTAWALARRARTKESSGALPPAAVAGR